jgi:hypothetical protein
VQHSLPVITCISAYPHFFLHAQKETLAKKKGTTKTASLPALAAPRAHAREAALFVTSTALVVYPP